MPRRSDDTERVGLNCTVRSRISSKLSKLSGPEMNCAIGAALSRSTPGVTSTSVTRRTRCGACELSAIVVSPPSDMPTTIRASGASAPIVTATSVAFSRGENGPSARWSEWPCPGRSIATSGRSSASATVSQVWAFCAPPCRRTISGGSSPQISALRPAPVGRDLDGLAPHLRGPGPREAELLGVLVEQPELVVVDHHRRVPENQVVAIWSPSRPRRDRRGRSRRRRAAARTFSAW